MKRFWIYLTCWFRASLQDASLRCLDVKIERLDRERLSSSRRLLDISEQNETDKQEAIRRINQRYEQMEEELSKSRLLNKQLQEALNASREELDTAKLITIPGLVASNKVLIDRWNDESQVYARRMAVSAMKDNEL